ncbi:hypothetical protein N072000002_13650 [Clostridium tetani]|uniref:CRISPR-associated protein Cmr3 n=1 Tax=Clostridium tetani TaxID=1513 RepID=A0ABC8EE97_CLOTA|nr:type III-B CRISPR module-associated Cmr3 family protein [Clostridium tetani]BDR81185.1 hypothetical protein K234311028_14310 [Clostridium tetani]BDR89564.1 hypothetical protein N072000002_13650 [Clostridium tetani]
MEFNLIKIKPCDNTFFGDGNQFDFDISRIMKSKNTPYPSVFFGAIFTAILTYNDDFRKSFFENLKYDHEDILEIGQVYLFNEKDNEIYIKAPMDLFMDFKGDIDFGKFKKEDNRLNSLSYNYILINPKDKEYKRLRNMYINIKNIYDSYLKKQRLRIKLKSEDEIFIKNYKVGIGINKKTKNIEEGKLYKIEQTEFMNNSWSYIVEYKIKKDYLKDSISYNEIEIKDLNKGYLKLGGENKACKFESIDNKEIKKFNLKKEQPLINKTYKIIFTSDAYFNDSINKVFKDLGIKILGLSNDKPIYIGGYDMQKKGSAKKGSVRTMYKGYSAGTVILARVTDDYNQDIDIYEVLKNNNVKGFNNLVIIQEDL